MCDGMEMAGTASGLRRLLSVRIKQGRWTSTGATRRRPAAAPASRRSGFLWHAIARGAHDVGKPPPPSGHGGQHTAGTAVVRIDCNTNNSNSQSLVQLGLLLDDFPFKSYASRAKHGKL